MSLSQQPDIARGVEALAAHLDAEGLAARHLSPSTQAVMLLVAVALGRTDLLSGDGVDLRGLRAHAELPLASSEKMLATLALALTGDREYQLGVGELFVHSSLDRVNTTLVATALAIARETLTLDAVIHGGAFADVGADRPRVVRTEDGDGWEVFVGDGGSWRWQRFDTYAEAYAAGMDSAEL